jgi:FlaG/FlaF family flagellin (archaellin)
VPVWQFLTLRPSLPRDLCARSHQGFAVSVNFVAASDAFPAGFDPKSGTVTFQPGQTSQSVPFTWACDSGDNDDRVVTITLSNPSSLLTVSATNRMAALTVQDDDNVRFSGCRGRGCLPGQ